MTEKSAFQQAVERAAAAWPKVGAGDPNTVDLYWHATRVMEILKSRLPGDLPDKHIGLSLVDLTDKHLINKSLIRECSANILVARAIQLVDSIQDHKLLPTEREVSYVAALHAWHGCVYMAKLLRKTSVVPGGEAPITPETRFDGYNWLSDCWRIEETRGNLWVRYGVSLARLWEKGRKQDEFKQLVVENWVPNDSPYWDP